MGDNLETDNLKSPSVEFYDPKIGFIRIDLDTTSPRKEGEILVRLLAAGVPKERFYGFDDEKK